MGTLNQDQECLADIWSGETLSHTVKSLYMIVTTFSNAFSQALSTWLFLGYAEAIIHGDGEW
jgi:hypothetical protein